MTLRRPSKNLQFLIGLSGFFKKQLNHKYKVVEFLLN